MTTLTGRTLSHYRLEAKIGAGGMGEVYRGIDTRLERPVAVKILPPDLLQDDERRRRFTHEAKAASALNHPNIVTIYDVGSEAGIDLIVMEYVEGKTLDEHIGRRPMAIGPLLRCATQIADALAAAHAAGIVHRDLKPTNVMVTHQGVVKVLDFGLAKLTEVSAPSGQEHTRTAPAASPTERGTILGTAAYMSPEQAEGGALDARSDIFSFGSVLYEMATGRRAFQGSTTMSTIAAVLRDEPPHVSTITAAVPHDLEVLINRCLRKDPNRRFQHMSDLKVALQELKEDSESGRLMMSVGPAPPLKRRPGWPIAAAALVAIAAVAGWFMFGRSTETAPAYELTRLTFDTGLTVTPAMSPDGKLVVYASDRASRRLNLWLQQVEGGQAVQLTHHEGGAMGPAFSPDSSRIAYSGDGKDEGVFVIPAIGGEPRKLASEGNFPKFSPDGSRLAYWVRDGSHARLRVIAVTGGEPTRVAPQFDGASPLWSRDGSHLLAVGRVDIKAPRGDAFDWFAISLNDGAIVRTGAAAALRAQKVLPKSIQIIPSPEGWSGQSVLFSVPADGAANVWRVALNPATFQVEGAAEQLTFGTGRSLMPSMSSDGKMAFMMDDFIGDYWQLPIDANAATVAGARTQIMKSSSSDQHALSLDGTTLFFCSHRNGQSEIRSRDLRTGKETSLVTSPNLQHVGAVTADGATFMFTVPGRTLGRFLATTSGGTPRKICEECTHTALSKDASKLLHIMEPDHQTYRLLDIAAGASTELMKGANHEFNAATLSPDGRWAAVTTTAGYLFLVPVRGSLVEEQEWITLGKLSQGQYQWPRFSPDGAAIYFGSSRDGNTCLYAQRLSPSGQPSGEPVAIEHLHEPSAVGHPHSVEVGADKIVLSLNRGSSNIWLRQPRK